MTYIITNQSFLYHHGVKGMKWGHRKDVQKISNNKKTKSEQDINNTLNKGIKARKRFLDKYGFITERDRRAMRKATALNTLFVLAVVGNIYLPKLNNKVKAAKGLL